jgi:GTPase SAR1 family protein
MPSVFSFHSVGKTSLMNQYVNKRFSNQYKATIGTFLVVGLPLQSAAVDQAVRYLVRLRPLLHTVDQSILDSISSSFAGGIVRN